MTYFLVRGRLAVLALLFALPLAPLGARASLELTPREPSKLSPGAPGVPRVPELKSNMGFKLERPLDPAPGKPAHHFVSVPLFNGLGDIADASLANPCDIVGGVGDGVVDARDLLCSWWTSRAGSMTVSRRDETLERWQSLTARRDPITGVVEFFGDWTEPLIAIEAFVVTADGPSPNPVTIVGSHDPMAPCRAIDLGPSGSTTLIVYNLFYHTMYQREDELLCGLKGMDWQDGDLDGLPDTCDGGMFDASTGAAMSVTAIDEDPASPTYLQQLTRTVQLDAVSGALVFSGPRFDLRPGDAYIATYSAPHSGTQSCQPHF